MFTHEDEKMHRRALERVRALPLAARQKLLKQAGILDENGQLAERYRPPEPSPEDQPAAARS